MGHSFWRPPTIFIAVCGEDITSIKRLGGWKSACLDEGYVEDSIK